MISGTRFQLLAQINRQTQLGRDIARGQVEIATGKRILNPSDDPVAAALVSDLARAQANEAAWMRNLDLAQTLAERADTALTAVGRQIGRATELLVAASSGTLSDENRAVIAQELRSIATDIATLADTRDPQGYALFRTDAALEMPISADSTLAPVATREAVFGGISTDNGPADLVSIINNAANAISEPDPALRRAAVDSSLDAMTNATNHIAAAHGEQGVRANRIERIQEQLKLSAVQLEEQKGTLEGANLPEVIARLQAKQLSLQAAQSVLVRVGQNSLFDLIR